MKRKGNQTPPKESSSSSSERSISTEVNDNKNHNHEGENRLSSVLDDSSTNSILNSLVKDCYVLVNVCKPPSLSHFKSNDNKSIAKKYKTYPGKKKCVQQAVVSNMKERLSPNINTTGMLINKRACFSPKEGEGFCTLSEEYESVPSPPEAKFVPIHEVPTFCDVATQTHSGWFSIDRFRDSNESIQFYTCFNNYREFTYVFDTVCPKPWNIKPKYEKMNILSTRDGFFLTVMKLKQATPDVVLSQLFNLSVDNVFTIFETWLNCMYEYWSRQHLPHKNLMYMKMLNNFTSMHEANLKGLTIQNISEYLKERKLLKKYTTFKCKYEVDTEEPPMPMKEFSILFQPLTKKYLLLLSKIYFACCILGGYKDGRTL